MNKTKTLLIVFVKNIILGKVKTRLAKTIGNKSALAVYKQLVEITEKETKNITAAKHIYFSEEIIDTKWRKVPKFIQKGADLGEKMQNAFKKGFNDGYEKIILIGSDLPNISPAIIKKGFEVLENSEVVFGPAEDGGYYLVGMTQQHFSVFQNKQWSTASLLKETVLELTAKGVKSTQLKTLNDIDTFEDLEKSSLNKTVIKQ